MGAGGGWTGRGSGERSQGQSTGLCHPGQFKNLVSVGNKSFSPPSSACHSASGLESESVSHSFVSNSL